MTNITDFTERRQIREREIVDNSVPAEYNSFGYCAHGVSMAQSCGGCGPLGRVWLVGKYERHTAAPQSFAPSWDQLHDMEAKLEHARARLVGALLVGSVLGFAFGWWASGHHLLHQ